MRLNTGPAFYHPVTHRLIETGQWYEGSAHLEHETEETSVEDEIEETSAISDVQTEEATEQKQKRRKSSEVTDDAQ